MDELIKQALEKHIEDLSLESLQGIDIDSIGQLKYELTTLFSLHIVSQQSELLKAYDDNISKSEFFNLTTDAKIEKTLLAFNCG